MKLIVLLFLFFALTSINVCVFAKSKSVDGRDEEYRVYERAIGQMFAGEKALRKPVITFF